MAYHPGDTICALATAAGGAARGMVRVSGPGAIAIAARCFQADDRSAMERLSRATAVAGEVRVGLPHAEAGSVVPCDLFVWPTTQSYTREPVVELHTIGSPPILEAVLAALCRSGARLAEPGEFTLRAFLAGRLDLTQAEAVLGVIDADDPEELNAALAQLAGGLARPLYQLRDELLQLLAEIEAGLDFVDEDIEFVSSPELQSRFEKAVELLQDLDEQMASRHLADAPHQVALIGPPNVGKSSLFNALVARHGIPNETSRSPLAAALVSPKRGTTRDYLTASILLGGIRCELVDTAGRDETSAGPPIRRLSDIEQAAQSMAAACGARAAVRAYCIDASDFSPDAFEDSCVNPAATGSRSDIIVATKSDLAERPLTLPREALGGRPAIATSSRTGEGLEDLCALLRELFSREEAGQHGQAVRATADRCRDSIRLAAAALSTAGEVLVADGGNELVAEELRAALAELGKVLGAVYTDDLLDRIFSTFCIGK